MRGSGIVETKHLIVMVVVLMLLALLVVAISFRSSTEGEVVGHSWTRSTQEQEYMTISERTSRSRIPEDARNVQRCGSVYIAKVWHPRYCFEVDRWVNTYQHQTSGNDRHPYWYNIAMPENKRLTEGTQRYWIQLQTSEGISAEELPYHVWAEVSVGAQVRITRRLFQEFEDLERLD